MPCTLASCGFQPRLRASVGKILGNQSTIDDRGLGLPQLPAAPRCDRFPRRTRPPVQKRGRPVQLSDAYQQPLQRGAGLSLRRGDIGRAAARTGLRTARAGPTVAHASCFQTCGAGAAVAALRWPGARDEPCSSSACSGDAPWRPRRRRSAPSARTPSATSRRQRPRKSGPSRGSAPCSTPTARRID